MGSAIVGLPAEVAFGVVMLACASAAFGQETAEEQLLQLYGDASTISIATGAMQPLGRAPAVATVITAEDIQAMGAVDLDEVMETVPGMHVARNGTTNNTAIYVMRGIYNVNTVFLTNCTFSNNQVAGGNGGNGQTREGAGGRPGDSDFLCNGGAHVAGL